MMGRKIPGIVATGVICLALGVGGGVLGMAYFGYSLKPPRGVEDAPQGGEGGRGAAIPLPLPPGPGGFGLRGGGGDARAQLATLVAKLDQLTGKPLTVTLSDDQQKKLCEHLDALAGGGELSDDDAWARLDAILEIIKHNRETMEAAGYRWPVQRPGFGGAGGVDNPFKDGDNRKQLKALLDRLTKPNVN